MTELLFEGPGLRVLAPGRAILALFDVPHETTSWAIVGGGESRTKAVIIVEVHDRELGLDVDPVAFLERKLASYGHEDAVGMMTSRDLAHVHVRSLSFEGIGCTTVATVGLGNALAAGDPPGFGHTPGTINVICRLDVPLTQEARLEALSIATEARTLAVFEADVASRRSGRRSTGTGTDCIVVASPCPVASEDRQPYAGKHTSVGHVVGATVLEAMRDGIARWKETVGT